MDSEVILTNDGDYKEIVGNTDEGEPKKLPLLRCGRCRRRKKDSLFRKDKKLCKECERARNASKRYGLNRDEYKESKKIRFCQCCNRKFAKGRKRVIDHCHTTEKFRGVICNSCNIILGHSKDSTEILKRVIEYLNKAEIGGIE